MKIEEKFISCAAEHIVKHGDTDIFPYPFEIKFIECEMARVTSALAGLDISQYRPMSLIESITPKTKYGFRVAHQPFPIDTVLFTALVLSIYDKVEAGRDPAANGIAFSYRKKTGEDPEIFEPDHTYRDWLGRLNEKLFATEYSHAIRTDISDFYSRIYRHRLENILDSLSGETTIVKRIEKFVADWRGGQSFGLPVGSAASRLLAEAALHDTDLALLSEGYDHTRYVDDMVLFAKHGQDPYAALAFLAKHLTENEGLSLNNQKTKIEVWDAFISNVSTSTGEDDKSKQESATDWLVISAYGKDSLGEEALAALMLKDLSKELEELLAEDFWNMGQIRVVLHAMRLVEKPDVAAYIRENLTNLAPFSKDVCLLITDFYKAGIPGFENLEDEIVELLLSPRMQPLDCARAWFLELGVRGVVAFSPAQIRRLDILTGTLDIRQLHIIRWRANDINYFRSRKARVSEIQAWAQPSFIFGASCLPRDEYSHWIRGIKSRLQFPLGKEFAEWCLSKHGSDPL